MGGFFALLCSAVLGYAMLRCAMLRCAMTPFLQGNYPGVLSLPGQRLRYAWLRSAKLGFALLR
jgi:hypothetical protein